MIESRELIQLFYSKSAYKIVIQSEELEFFGIFSSELVDIVLDSGEEGVVLDGSNCVSLVSKYISSESVDCLGQEETEIQLVINGITLVDQLRKGLILSLKNVLLHRLYKPIVALVLLLKNFDTLVHLLKSLLDKCCVVVCKKVLLERMLLFALLLAAFFSLHAGGCCGLNMAAKV